VFEVAAAHSSGTPRHIARYRNCETKFVELLAKYLQAIFVGRQFQFDLSPKYRQEASSNRVASASDSDYPDTNIAMNSAALRKKRFDDIVGDHIIGCVIVPRKDSVAPIDNDDRRLVASNVLPHFFDQLDARTYARLFQISER
jgi:hypothetical protein